MKTEGHTINVAVVENDPLRLVGLQSIFDSIAGLQLTALSVAQVGPDRYADVVLIGNYSGIRFVEAISALRAVRPDLPVIVTGVGTDDEAVLKALSYGARGFVDEMASPFQMAQAIQKVYEGFVWAPRHVISIFIERTLEQQRRSLRPHNSTLTNREKQVLKMLVEGHSNKEIGTPLGISERTVKAHIGKMMRKVGAKNRIALSVEAISQQLLLTANDAR